MTVKELKGKLMSAPVFAHSRWTEKYMVDSDVLDERMGCAYLQEREGKQLKPIGYRLRSLCSAERSFDTTPEEYLAVEL